MCLEGREEPVDIYATEWTKSKEASQEYVRVEWNTKVIVFK
jgi:hypothetical protein